MAQISRYSLTPRVARRRQQLRPRGLRAFWSRRLFRWGLILYLLGSLIAGGAWLYRSPYLTVSEVTVQDTKKLNPQVLEHAEEAAEEAKGKPILELNLGEIVEAIRQLPLVREVIAYKHLPQEVIIAVEEREPWAIWQVGDTRYVVDRDGTVIGDQPHDGPLPTVVDVSGLSLQASDRVDLEPIHLAQRLSQLLPQKLGTQTVAFEYASNGGLVAIIDGGFRARFGDSTDLERKIAIWKAILEKAAEMGVVAHHVDLRFGNRPFFR